MLTKTLAQITGNSTEHCTHNSGNDKNVHPPRTRVGKAKGRRINLTTLVHEELTVWRHLVASLATRPTHLRKIRPHPPTWIGSADASLTGMGGVCRSLNRYWHVWQLTFSTPIRAHILTDANPNRFLTIIDLNLAAYIAYLHLFVPRMAPLKHISTGVDNTAAEIWACRGVSAQLPTSAPSYKKPRG